MTESLTFLLVLLSAPVLFLGVAELVYYPLALAFELRRRREPCFERSVPLVTVIVPAYNEERVIANCIESILGDAYPRTELVLVDDGSTDRTLEVMRRYGHHDRVTVVARANGGKAAALNAGLARANGEILCFVDADGIFTPTTIGELLTGFDDPRVGAVCGNDEPVNLDRHQTRLLALLTHGTAFVRRALARINCLTIVSGNLGAFRRSVIDEVGGFTEGFVGEDLELTWRVHRAGYRVNFRPRAIVYAEVPSSLRALWKQRVRWTRGHAQTARLHRDMFFRRAHGAIGWYLPLNVAAMLFVPLIQLAAVALLAVLIASGSPPLTGDLLATLAWLGLAMGMVALCFAITLDRAFKDLRFLYVAPAWLLFSIMMSVITAWSLLLEARGRPSKWNKLARTGVVSRPEVAVGNE
jgi:biofilm PGA synthesis N-glycosyltransferase PgaC